MSDERRAGGVLASMFPSGNHLGEKGNVYAVIHDESEEVSGSEAYEVATCGVDVSGVVCASLGWDQWASSGGGRGSARGAEVEGSVDAGRERGCVVSDEPNTQATLAAACDLIPGASFEYPGYISFAGMAFGDANGDCFGWNREDCDEKAEKPSKQPRTLPLNMSPEILAAWIVAVAKEQAGAASSDLAMEVQP